VLNVARHKVLLQTYLRRTCLVPMRGIASYHACEKYRRCTIQGRGAFARSRLQSWMPGVRAPDIIAWTTAVFRSCGIALPLALRSSLVPAGAIAGMQGSKGPVFVTAAVRNIAVFRQTLCGCSSGARPLSHFLQSSFEYEEESGGNIGPSEDVLSRYFRNSTRRVSCWGLFQYCKV
jgi:hypothetical protein